LRLVPLVAAACCALALAAPASSAVLPGFPEDARRHAAAPAERERFLVPLRGRWESGFGPRWGRLHSGVDISVVGDARVRAAASGTVVATGWPQNHWGYGLVVKIRHRPGLVTMYAHLSASAVRRGERVERGDRIATAGCTGSCTGTHLHFEVHRRGRAVDPWPYLRGKLR
jgi:murein DD-endopeptidase MepM/ murein hydrolase activator NlpD